MMIGTLAWPLLGGLLLHLVQYDDWYTGWPLLGGLLHLVQYDDWYTGLALVKWAVTFGTV